MNNGRLADMRRTVQSVKGLSELSSSATQGFTADSCECEAVDSFGVRASARASQLPLEEGGTGAICHARGTFLAQLA